MAMLNNQMVDGWIPMKPLQKEEFDVFGGFAMPEQLRLRLLWEKEELQLQLDSHMRFVPGSDERFLMCLKGGWNSNLHLGWLQVEVEACAKCRQIECLETSANSIHKWYALQRAFNLSSFFFSPQKFVFYWIWYRMNGIIVPGVPFSIISFSSSLNFTARLGY